MRLADIQRALPRVSAPCSRHAQGRARWPCRTAPPPVFRDRTSLVSDATNNPLCRRQLGRRLLDHGGRVGDQLEQHPRGFGRAARALLPLPQRRQRHAEAPGEAGLRQAEPAPQPGDAERVARPFRREPARQLSGGQDRGGVGIPGGRRRDRRVPAPPRHREPLQLRQRLGHTPLGGRHPSRHSSRRARR